MKLWLDSNISLDLSRDAIEAVERGIRVAVAANAHGELLKASLRPPRTSSGLTYSTCWRSPPLPIRSYYRDPQTLATGGEIPRFFRPPREAGMAGTKLAGMGAPAQPATT